MAITGLTTFLWFDSEAEEAAQFYVATFPGARLGSVSRYGEGGMRPAGTAMVAEFELFGQPFSALNGGPQFTHSEAVSFQVFCDTQDEVDYLWDALTADGGEESMCGWCKDRFGVSWQVIPRRLTEVLSSSDPEESARGFAAMMTMRKIDIAGLG
jgi:predicted 3-demethylubiquinone-9 3-methyltransferase (glyoxalase superfamily)